jgi:hypothetical protein
MASKKKHISVDFGKRISDALSNESDRASVILVASWIDHFLQIKLAHEFDGGNANARSALFSSNGPFATFAAKLNVAFCAGWIDSDVYHDLDIIRKMRNEFAHSIESHSLYDEPFPAMVARLRVPKREFHNWGELRASAIERGVVLFTGERPAEGGEDLDLTKITFRLAASVIIAVLVVNLGIPIDDHERGVSFVLQLPEHMRDIPE